MSKIYISTNSTKASDCFRPREEELMNHLNQIDFPTSDNCIKKFNDTELYFHFDSSNPEEESIDKYNDYLIKHNQSNPEFCSKFLHILPSIHNTEDSSKFRQIFKILIDDSIPDKYINIFDILRRSIEALNTSDTTLFLKDICNTSISLSQIKEKYPVYTENPAFQKVIDIFYKDNNNVFDCNNETHIDEYKQLREKLNISN